VPYCQSQSVKINYSMLQPSRGHDSVTMRGTNRQRSRAPSRGAELARSTNPIHRPRAGPEWCAPDGFLCRARPILARSFFSFSFFFNIPFYF
jgi:hypothetical protein